MSHGLTHHRVHEGSVQLADAADAEGAVAVRHEAGALVRVPPEDLRRGVRHVIHRAAAHLQPEAHVGRLQQDHGRIRAGPHGLLDQPQVWHLSSRKACFTQLVTRFFDQNRPSCQDVPHADDTTFATVLHAGHQHISALTNHATLAARLSLRQR